MPEEELNRRFPPDHYPENMLLAAVGENTQELPLTMTRDILAGVQFAMCSLEIPEQEVLRAYFAENRSDSDTQLLNTALKKLRFPTRWHYIRYGLNGSIERQANKAYADGYETGYRKGRWDYAMGISSTGVENDVLALHIESLNLSTRARKRLLRAGYHAVGDIVCLNEMQIQGIRQMGILTIREIAAALRELGIAHTAWYEIGSD